MILVIETHHPFILLATIFGAFLGSFVGINKELQVQYYAYFGWDDSFLLAAVLGVTSIL